MECNFPEVRTLEGNAVETGTITVKSFIDKQKEFLLNEKLESLAERTYYNKAIYSA